MGIGAIGNKIGEYTAKGVGKFAQNKQVRKLCEKFKDEPIKYAGYATLASLALKDAVGCYLYVTQSLNNKKIPEEKRRFVANMDLTNGILNIITQIGVTFALKRSFGPMFNKMFNKSFNKNASKELVTKLRKDSKAASTDIMRKLDAERKLQKTKENIFKAFSTTMDIFIATIFAKRIIVPFLSTPITQTLTNRHDKKMAEKNGVKPENKNAKPEENKTAQPAPQLNISDNKDTNLLSKFHK